MKYLWITILTVMLAGPVFGQGGPNQFGMLDNAGQGARGIPSVVQQLHARAEANRGVHRRVYADYLRETGQALPVTRANVREVMDMGDIDRRYADFTADRMDAHRKNIGVHVQLKRMQKDPCWWMPENMKGPTNCPHLYR